MPREDEAGAAYGDPIDERDDNPSLSKDLEAGIDTGSITNTLNLGDTCYNDRILPVGFSAGPVPVSGDVIERVCTRNTHRSINSRLSRVLSVSRSEKRQKEDLPPPTIPQSDLPSGIVGWESQDDPEHPLNFPDRKKWLVVSLVSALTFMTPFASSVLAPGIRYLNGEFGNTNIVLGGLPVSIYLFDGPPADTTGVRGYAVGPLILAGLSETFGRQPILIYPSAWFCIWQIGCALAPSLNTLIVFRFFAGVGGSASIVLGGAIIGDLFPLHERGRALAAFTFGPLVGPSIGPLIGAFVAQTIGWRWDFWITLIPAAIVITLIAIFSTETNHRVLIKRKMERLKKELGGTDLRSCYDEPDKPPASFKTIMWMGLTRPLKMLFMVPVLLAMSTYNSFAYGVLYLLFNTIPTVFEVQYGFSTGLAGLAYIPLGLGYTVGLVIFAQMSDKTIVRLTKKNNGVFEPEMRLVDCIYFALLLPVTFFWYGWAAHYQVHWIVPILGLFPFGVGILGLWQPLQAYIIDAYGHYAASGLAAFAVLRSVVAAFLPIAGPSMYASLGLGWGNSLLGFICVALIPVPLLIYRYGEVLRKRYPVKL